MAKPHEEDWGNGRDFEVDVYGPELDRDIDAPREVLARAAPDMARALFDLLAVIEGERKANDPTADAYVARLRATAVLRKAGVLNG